MAPLNLPNEIPAAPRLPGYHVGTDIANAEGAWHEAWALGYNRGWQNGADAEYGRGVACVHIAERERNHLAEELERVMEDRDDCEEELSDWQSKYRFLAVCTIVVTTLAMAGGYAIGALHGIMMT